MPNVSRETFGVLNCKNNGLDTILKFCFSYI